jgi:enoyl-CoA hydratase/carnithine racemase
VADRDVVQLALADHVLTIMDRPPARNALSQQMFVELDAALTRLDDEVDCGEVDRWVGILEAEGPTFCAGADLKVALEARWDAHVAGCLKGAFRY